MDRENLGIGALLTMVLLAAPVSAVILAPAPKSGGPVLVIGTDPLAVVEMAGGQVIGPYSAPWGVLAMGDPVFVENAMNSGAWRVIEAGWLSQICGAGLPA